MTPPSSTATTSPTTTTVPTSESQQKFLAQLRAQMLGSTNSSSSSSSQNPSPSTGANYNTYLQLISQLIQHPNGTAITATLAAAEKAAKQAASTPSTSASAATTPTMPKGIELPASSRSGASSPEAGAIIDVGSPGDAPDDILDGSSPESTHHSPPCSRSSSRSGPVTTGRPQRKLKIYCVDEKLDIIDYAKVIGNRAAGREYNVAESSIREWRKNEQKLRLQAENSRQSQPNSPEKEKFHQKLYADLVKYINANREDITWIKVRDKAQEFWQEYGSEHPEGFTTMHLQGWVARFILKAREANEIPEIAPPVSMPNTGVSSSSSSSTVFSTAGSSTSASTASSNLLNGAISMVPSTSTMDALQGLPKEPPAKRSRLSSGESHIDLHTSGSLASSPEGGSKSRRKNVAPKRVLDASVKTSAAPNGSPTPLDLSKTQPDVNANTTTPEKRNSSDVSKAKDSAPLEVC